MYRKNLLPLLNEELFFRQNDGIHPVNLFLNVVIFRNKAGWELTRIAS
ncbi:hypothetical protein [Priestia koreensis]|nr:hypothetical protein [Priestia koreensis]